MTPLALPTNEQKRKLEIHYRLAGSDGVLLCTSIEATSLPCQLDLSQAGVFFRKFTQKESQRLGLVGWVRNTPQNSVDGQIQGPREQVELMNAWLQTKGSDKSRIDKACFTHERTLDALEFTQFKIVK
uniref:acylphosphatase-1 isoform X1 n=1 Tax=Myxine glutinosa TaxID=7769 RepID=UPI00358EBEC8